MGSEGLEEKYQAVIELMNRSAKDGVRSSPHYGGEGVPIHPSNQGVCGRHGTEDKCVTHGDLVSSGGGTEMGRCGKKAGMEAAGYDHSAQTTQQPVRHAIRATEVSAEAVRGVGEPNST